MKLPSHTEDLIQEAPAANSITFSGRPDYTSSASQEVFNILSNKYLSALQKADEIQFLNGSVPE